MSSEVISALPRWLGPRAEEADPELAGDVVRVIGPDTEASRLGLLIPAPALLVAEAENSAPASRSGTVRSDSAEPGKRWTTGCRSGQTFCLKEAI